MGGCGRITCMEMKRQYHKWLDIFLVTKDAIVTFRRDFVAFVRDYDKYGRDLPSITEQPCRCGRCGWTGTVWDCEGDVDGDGSLGCPECLAAVEVYGE